MHSDVMSSSGAGQYYWCLSHSRVEAGDDRCPAKDQLGPYDSAREAEEALARIRQRNEEWDADDLRWEEG